VRFRSSTAVRLSTRLAVCCFLILSLAGIAQAEPSDVSTPEIETKRAEAQAAQAQLSELATQVELRAEEFAEIQAALDSTDLELKTTAEELQAARAELVAAQRVLAQRAERMYRSGGVNPIEVLLDTVSFRDLVTRLDFLSRIGRSDAHVVEAVRETERRVELAQASLESRRNEQATLRDNAAVKKTQVEKALEQQANYIDRLDDEIADLVDEERERQRIEAEAAAARAAEAARALEAARATAAARVVPPVDVEGLGVGHPEVVSIALQYVGVPYVWGGASPSGFDCSGLTQYAYEQIGISLPRNSRSQYLSGEHIPSDRVDLLTPGDLVFFGYDGDPSQVHHVGIYVGNGDYLHAPQTGETVKVQSLIARIQVSGDYVGASRF
jgi:cell wall-associated NlpC family hydrolase